MLQVQAIGRKWGQKSILYYYYYWSYTSYVAAAPDSIPAESWYIVKTNIPFYELLINQ